MLVVGEQVEHQFVRARQVFRVAGEGNPAKRSLPLAEERANVLGDESGYLEGVPHAGVQGHGANIVAVVERDRAALPHLEHRAHVRDDRLRAARDIFRRIPSAKLRGFLE